MRPMQIRDEDRQRNVSEEHEAAGAAARAERDGEDIALMARIGAGDIAAFEALYERFGALVYSTALQALADTQAAEDVAQEIFVRLWRRPGNFDPKRGRFVSWLLSVTRNRSVDELRSRGRRRRLQTDPPEAAENSPDPSGRDDPALSALASDDRAAVREALAGLPQPQRQAIEMAYFGGMTQVEIAEALQQPLGTVKTRVRMGMRKMRASLLARGRVEP